MYKVSLNFLKFRASLDGISAILLLLSVELTLSDYNDANTGCCICHIYK